MENDARRYKRFALDSMKINGKIMFSKVVDILDISLGGLSLKTDRRLNIGSEYTLKIDEKNMSFSFKANVVWASLHESIKSSSGDLIPIYAIGMKFNDVSNDKISALITFVEAHKQAEQEAGEVYKEKDHRLHMRFVISENGKAALTCRESYTLKTISMSGMLIESGNAMKVEDKLPLEVLFPENIRINFLARVVSCTLKKDKATEQFAIGIEFLDMQEKDRSILQRFIRMLSQQNKPSL